MKSSKSIKTAIFKAVQDLDPEALSFHMLDTLSNEQTDNLLTVADHAVMTEMRDTAAGIDDVSPQEFVDYAAGHSRVLMNYLTVRGLLLGETYEEDDTPDLGIF